MKKTVCFCIVSMVFILLCAYGFTSHQAHSDKNDAIVFPDFTITINGHISTAANNYKTAMFPLFLYHDTLYYPLTAASKNLLNLQEGESTNENEIILFQADEPAIQKYIPETIAAPHPEYSQRELSSVKVSNKVLTINGNLVAAPDMEYPLLEYAFVTYMPITSEFITEQLHGSYDLDEAGLKITTVSEDLLYHAE